jgi:hypothetical protein
MAKYTRFINDDQWKMLKTQLPKPRRSPKGGWPPADNREVLEGLFWVLCTGARRQDRPNGYTSVSTWWRWLKLWEEQGVCLDVWQKFLSMLDEKGALDWQEASIDRSFVPAKKGGLLLGLPNGAKERSGWWWSTARVFLSEAPLSRHRPRKSPWPKKRSKR